MTTLRRTFDSPSTRVAVVVALFLLGVSIQGRLTAQLTLAVILDHGPIALAVLVAAFGLGTLLSPLVQPPNLPRRRKVMLSVGMGLGGLSILYLILGTLGWLHRPLQYLVIGLLMVWGAGWIVRQIIQTPRQDEAAAELDRGRWWWLASVPFLVLILLVAVTPPGVLWAEEGYGYDELEYHLQVPREYYDRGQIAYLPHNVYANFPSNVEMLGMLCMILAGDAHDGAMSAKLINGALALLAAAALWLMGREKSAAMGRTTGLLALSTGWVVYLSGLFFVENGLLFFAALATACVLKAVNFADESSSGALGRSAWRWVVLGGLFCGFAAGCKYTAIPLVMLPLFLGLFVTLPSFGHDPSGAVRSSSRHVWLSRCAYAGAFLVASAVSFSPWLIKNAVMTGNPLFPLFNYVFQGAPPEWGPDETAHWEAGHQPEANELTLGGKARAWWHRIPGDPKQRVGAVSTVLAVLAIFTRWRARSTVFCAAVLVAQTLLWASTTHLYARMAVPMIIPIVLLAAGQIHSPAVSKISRFAPGLILTGTLALNSIFISSEYVSHLYGSGEKLRIEGYYGAFTEGKWPGYEHLAVINHDLPKDARVLVLGDAKGFYFQRSIDYCVVFNRHPLAEAIRRATADVDIVDWLTDRGYTHIFIHWAEVHRLRRTYGFPEEINERLFETLTAFRVKRTHVFTIDLGTEQIPYAELYEMPK